MEIVAQFFGRFHPLLVHLPIGILYLAFIFEVLSYFSSYKKLREAIQPALFCGALFAVLAAGSGYLLSLEGGYDDKLLRTHQFTGIATAILSTVHFFLRRNVVSYFQDKGKRRLVRIFLFIPLIGMLSLTGHLGGSLTHGEDYLFQFTDEDLETAGPSFRFKSIEEVDSAILYRDIIEPILSSRCYDCHSSKKQKGQLRLDQVQFIEKGGKHGEVIVLGIPDSSLLYSRMMLPLEDEHHMPPNEKRQLSSAEIALVKSWIEEGAPFAKAVKNFKEASKITGYLSSILAQSLRTSIIPTDKVSPADAKAIATLTARGVLVVPVGSESNYLSVSFVNARSTIDKDLDLLLPLKDQLLWLNVGRTQITDEGLGTIGQLTKLSKLNLEYTGVGDAGLEKLLPLVKLASLNLVSTKSSDAGIARLTQLSALKQIFAYQTQVTSAGISNILTKSPGINIDTGHYSLPALVTDTTVFKGKR
jgi:uncharacterized membrane protein/mono/diheme cytochrome c family protein